FGDEVLSVDARRGLGVIGQRAARDLCAVSKRNAKMLAHRRHPGFVDGQIERAGAGRDEIVERIRQGSGCGLPALGRRLPRGLFFPPACHEWAAAPPTGRSAKFGCGMAAIRSRVYCACGADSTCSVRPVSTIFPARITITRPHKRRTTLRPCDPNRYLLPSDS